MIKLFNKILSVLLALVVLTATSGFRIYSHDCECCGIDEISIVEIEDCCEGAHEAMACDLSHKQESACCTDVVQTVHDCEDAHCCEVESDFFKIRESFDKSKIVTVNAPKLTNITLQIIDTEPLIEKINMGFLDISKDSPPKIPIRDFVIFSHTLKIAC